MKKAVLFFEGGGDYNYYVLPSTTPKKCFKHEEFKPLNFVLAGTQRAKMSGFSQAWSFMCGQRFPD